MGMWWALGTILTGLAVGLIVYLPALADSERAVTVSGPPRSPRRGSLSGGRPSADRARDRDASLPGVSGPARSAEGRCHELGQLFSGPSNRPGFGGWAFWAQCKTCGVLSHDFPSEAEAIAWVQLHGDFLALFPTEHFA